MTEPTYKVVNHTGWSEMYYNGKPAPAWVYKIVARTLVVVEAAQSAGFRGDVLRTMAATAMAESGGKWWITNTNTNGTTDYGIFQINSKHLNDPTLGFTLEGAKDPYRAAQYAYTLYVRAKYKLTPWYAFTNGRYSEFLPFVDLALTYTQSR